MAPLAFVPPLSLGAASLNSCRSSRHLSSRHVTPKRALRTPRFRGSAHAAGTDAPKENGKGEANKEEDPMAVPNFKFDPESEKDAFGRDPKKETDFWRGAAQELIQSEEVKEAVKGFEEGGGEMSEEEKKRQEYLAFIASLDEAKGEGGQTGGDAKEES